MKLLLLPLLAGAVLLSGCVSTPKSRAEENADLFQSFTAYQKETILKGEVDLEFTPEMVLMAAGAPDRKAKRRSNLGATEVWTYYQYRARPIHGYGYGGHNSFFAYNRMYGSYVRNYFWDTHAVVASYGEPEKNLVVDFQDGRVVSYEMVQ